MGVWSRILTRYLAGALLAYGLIPADVAAILRDDPEVAAGIGLVLTAAVEGAYALAKRWGWTT